MEYFCAGARGGLSGCNYKEGEKGPRVGKQSNHRSDLSMSYDDDYPQSLDLSDKQTATQAAGVIINFGVRVGGAEKTSLSVGRHHLFVYCRILKKSRFRCPRRTCIGANKQIPSLNYSRLLNIFFFWNWRGYI